jgi:O-antigen ligase
MLWLGISTGPWVLRTEVTGILSGLHYARTLFPFAVAAVSVLLLASAQNRVRLPGPLKLWSVYGLVGLAACIMSPEPFDALYWGVCYLAAIVAAWVYVQGPDPLAKAVQLNYLSWLMTTALLLVLVVAARDQLIVQTSAGFSAYGVVRRTGDVGGVLMSRASGMARFGAVPGIVALGFLLLARGWLRVACAVITFACAALVGLLHSRGAIVGFGLAAVFVTLLWGRTARQVGVVLLLLCVLGFAFDYFPERVKEPVTEYILRGQSEIQFLSMTGRIDAWIAAWKEIKKSPIWGWGPQADRYLLGGAHVHNTYLYTMLEAGFLGTAAFVAGLGWAWVLFFRALRRGIAEKLGQRVFLVQVGGILAFFTIRSIPEVSGAMFGVDLMVMLPILAYLGILDRQRVIQRRGTSESPPARWPTANGEEVRPRESVRSQRLPEASQPH